MNLVWTLIHRCVLAVVSVLVLTQHVIAQTYPTKPVRIIVGFPPGGGADGAARLAAQKLSENLGQALIVENLPGASSSISIERVASLPPDGYTLLLMSSSGVAHAALATRLPYDLERDFAPISMLVIAPNVLVAHASLGVQSLEELVALAKASPGKLNYGSSGVGGPSHFAGELLSSMAGIRMTHVPYKGSADIVAANLAGQIEVSFPTIPSVLAFLKTGKLRAIAVTSSVRAALLPAVPTLDESGLRGYDLSVWYGLLARKAVPREIIAKLNGIISRSFGATEIKELLLKQGSEARTSSPEQFAALIKRELEQNIQIVKSAGIKAE